MSITDVNTALTRIYVSNQTKHLQILIIPQAIHNYCEPSQMKSAAFLYCGIVPVKKEFFRASLYVWYLQYWALCDDLLAFKCEQGSDACLFL